MSNTLVHAVESRTPRNSKRRIAFAAGGALLAAAAAAAVPFQSASAAPAAAASCVMQELPMPEDQYFSIVTGMSGDGSVIAYRTYPAGLEGDVRYPYLYTGGEAVEVPMPGTDQYLGDVNSGGTAVGSSVVDDVNLPYVYRNGVLTELAADGGGSANGINESGDIAGSSGSVPVVWHDGEVKPQELPLPKDANMGWAAAIGDDGTVVGGYQDTNVNGVPYVWHPDGTAEALPLPDGIDPATATATAHNVADNWASGSVLTPDAEYGLRWNLEEGTVEILDMIYTPAINEAGTAVGERTPDAVYQEAGPESEAVALPGLTAPADNTFGDTATEINADGSLLAGQVYAGQDATDTHILKAVVWTCE